MQDGAAQNAAQAKDRAVLYRPDGTQREVSPADGRRFTLAEAQKLVSGMVERLSLGRGRIMLVNEEGKIFGMAPNAAATRIAAPSLGVGDFIVGDALVCDRKLFS
jgi:hypothetical protein